jgi:hypothetical protein
MHRLITLAILAALMISLPMTVSQAQDNTEESAFKPTVNTFLWLHTGFLNDETDNGKSTFQFKRARFGFNGKVDERIGYHLMIEGIHGGLDPRVYQAWIEYKLHPLASFRVGQFKYPFFIETYPCFVWWKFLNMSYVGSGVVRYMGRPTSNEYGCCRDVGVQMSSNYKLNTKWTVMSKLMLMNGNGILQTDNNNDKDVVFRLGASGPIGISFGTAFYQGTYSSSSHGFREVAVNVYFQWLHEINGREFRLQGEVVSADYETSGADIKPFGYYVYGTHFLTPEVE